MASARELADIAAHNYQILKCHITVDADRENDCVPILELIREGKTELSVLTDRRYLSSALALLAQDDGPPIEACVLNIEVYTSHFANKARQENKALYLQDPDVQEGLLTVAVTREGDAYSKLFLYEYLDDGGLYFEEAPINQEALGELLVEMKGLWQPSEPTISNPAINNGKGGP